MSIEQIISKNKLIKLVGTELITNDSVDEIYLIVKKFQRNYQGTNFTNKFMHEFSFIDRAFLTKDLNYFNKSVFALVKELKTHS